MNENLTAKGTLSYAEFRGDQSLDLFGLYIPRGGLAPNNAVSTANIDAVTTPLGVRSFSSTRQPFGLHTNAESSFVAELQLQGRSDKFNWQGGLYYESSDPLGKSGTAAPLQTACGPVGSAVPAGASATEVAILTDPGQVCLETANQANSLGRVGYSTTLNSFRDTAIYWQGIYSLTDQIKLTGGIRYTWDEMQSEFQVINLRYYAGTINSGFNG